MEDFRNRVLQNVRDVMTREKFNESSLKSWNGNETKGFEMVFERMHRGVTIVSGVVGQIFITSEGGFEAILTTYLKNDDLRTTINCFSFPDSSSLYMEISSGLSKLIAKIGIESSLSHVLMYPIIRDTLLAQLKPEAVTHMAASNKAIRATLTSAEVDRSYWKMHLSRATNPETVRRAIADRRSFWRVYAEKMMEKRREAVGRRDAQELHDPLMVPMPGRRMPFINDPMPRFNDPDAEWYNPNANPQRNPYQENPRYNPPNPLMDPRPNFGGGGNADINPFGDPMNREMFRPPRGPGGGFGGQPFERRGGNGGGFNGDFI